MTALKFRVQLGTMFGGEAGDQFERKTKAAILNLNCEAFETKGIFFVELTRFNQVNLQSVFAYFSMSDGQVSLVRPTNV